LGEGTKIIYLKVIKEEKMKKNIFVVPTYHGHFEYAYKLRDSFDRFDLNSDLLFVLSDAEESSRFEEGSAKKCFLYDGTPRGVDNRGIITIKKLQGVELARTLNYDYAIVLDCESLFTRNFNAYEVSKFLSEQKIVYSSITNNHILIEINRLAAEFFDDEEKEKLKKLTSDFKEYFWFNNLAFYDLSNYGKFIQKMHGDDYTKFYSRMSSGHFDHIIYIYYCLLYEDYKIINLNEKIGLPLNPYANFHLGALESIGDRSTRTTLLNEWSQKIINEINPFWMPYGTTLVSRNCFIMFHEDRA